MVWAFLLLTLVVGLYVSRGATTFREYAVGNKRFGTISLVATILATTFGGGSIIREVPNIYDQGIVWIAYIFGWIMKHYIINLLALRMGPFMQHLSMAETIGSVYGKYPRVIAALLATSLVVGAVAIQINVMSCAIGMCMDAIDPSIVTVLATLILISYAALGGIRAVTITDLLQLATFVIVIPLLVRFVFVKTDKSFLEVLWFVRKQEEFQCSNLFQFNGKGLNIILGVLNCLFMFDPSIIQRIYMTSSPMQVKKVFLRVTPFHLMIDVGIFLTALLVFVGDPTLLQQEVWSYILVDMSPVYKGCLVISILAMTMSTADSYLHTAAIMVGHDIMEGIRGSKTVSAIHKLRLAKCTTLVTGLLAMIVTVYHPDLFELTTFVLHYLMTFFLIAIVPPFILAIFGFRGTTRTALMGMTIGILVYLACEKWIPELYHPVFSCLANGLAMIAAHYLLPQPPGKGWIEPDHQQQRMVQLIRAFKKYKKSIDLE